MAKFWQWLAWILVSACALAAPVFGSWGWPVLVIWCWVALAHKGELSRLTQEIETVGGKALICRDLVVLMISGVIGYTVFWGLLFLPVGVVIAALTVGVLGFKTWVKTVDRM